MSQRRSTRKQEVSADDFEAITAQLQHLADYAAGDLKLFKSLPDGQQIEVYRLGTLPLALKILSKFLSSAHASIAERQFRTENEALAERLAARGAAPEKKPAEKSTPAKSTPKKGRARKPTRQG